MEYGWLVGSCCPVQWSSPSVVMTVEVTAEVWRVHIKEVVIFKAWNFFFLHFESKNKLFYLYNNS